MAVNLKGLLPDYFKEVKEMKEIMNVEEITLGKLDLDVKKLHDNHFIQTCDKNAIAIYEKRFGIVCMPGDTLDYRRQRILQKYNYTVPFSIGFLRNRLTELYGNQYSMEMDYGERTIRISVTSAAYGAVSLLYDLLWDIIPAHILIDANQQVTNYVSGKIYTAAIYERAYVQTI